MSKKRYTQSSSANSTLEDSLIQTAKIAGKSYLLSQLLNPANHAGARQSSNEKLLASSSFSSLMMYISHAGGYRGVRCARYLKDICDALSRHHVSYGEQFRLMFFAGMERSAVVPLLDDLYANMDRTGSDATKWQRLERRLEWMVQYAISFESKVLNEQSQGLSEAQAIEAVAKELIDSHVLPPSPMVDIERHAQTVMDGINGFFASLIEADKRKDAEKLKFRYSFWWWVRSALIASFLVFSIYTIYSASTRPHPIPITDGKYTIHF